MNPSPYCANCRLHGWKQLEDTRQLQRCKNCKVVQYCGKDCQREHWKKVHKEQCDHFVKSDSNQDWAHKEADCLNCRQAAAVGKSKLKKPNNPNYECIYKEYNFPPSSCHPRPFPITGQPGDLLEKATIVLWQLLHKFGMIHPRVARDFREEMDKAFAGLMEIMLSIWENRKDFTHPGKMLNKANSTNVNGVFDVLATINEAIKRGKPVVDSFQLWNIIRIVHPVINEVYFISNGLKALKDPQAELPDELKELVSEGLVSQVKFLAVTDQVLDALATQIIPYQEVLKVICGGNINQTCHFCEKEIVIADVNVAAGGPAVIFYLYSMGLYTCGTGDCIDKGFALKKKEKQFAYAVISTITEQMFNVCDFCSLLPPKNDAHRCNAHRCNGCLTVMYCSEACMEQDWKIHKLFCKKDVEERKIKFGCSGRRKAAREGVELLEEAVMTTTQDDVGKEVVEKFKIKNAKKKFKK